RGCHAHGRVYQVLANLIAAHNPNPVPKTAELAPRSLLPPAAQSLVHLDEREEFVAPRLSQIQFRRERIRFIRKHFEIVGSPRLKALLRQACSNLCRLHEALLLGRELACFAIGDQGIRHIAKCALDCLLIRQQHLLTLCFCKPHVVLKFSALKDRLRKRARHSPQCSRTSEETIERGTLKTRISGQSDLREISCAGYSDLRVRGNQVLFCIANIWASLQQRGWNAYGNLWRVRLLCQRQSAWDISWIIAEQNAEIVFLLGDLPLQIGDFGLGRVHQLLCLAYIKIGADSVLLLGLRQLQRLLARVQSSLGNIQLQI